ncbi:MAG TPA: TonB-dependent receptor [Bacteroidota bacterium]|nr:TonB-dependent receptor [Bacteroidota bacterium]
MTKYVLRLLPVFCLSSLQAQPQGIDLRGIVADSATGEKLPFANVIILGTNKGAATNINGFYLIPNVLPGTYEIAASSVGYERRVQKIIVGSVGPLHLDFKIPSKAVEFSEVLVTEKGKRELIEINTSVHILDQQDLQRVPVTVQDDIFRSIQILPGIVSASDVNSHFYVRGGAGDQNLILLDGMKIYNPYHAFGAFSIFDPDFIKTTEVYTGAFPPGFGGRLSSVINLTTRDGRATNVRGKANINFLSSKLQLEGPLIGDIRWIGSVRKSLFKNTLGTLYGKDVPLSFYDAFVKVTRENEDYSRYAVQGFFSGDELISSNPAEPDYHWKNHAVGFTASGLIQDRVFVYGVGFENYFEARRDNKGSASVTPASTTVKETGLYLNATLYTDSHDLYFFGFEFSFPTLEYNLVNNFGVRRRMFSSYVESWSWVRYQTKVGDLQLDGGIHLDIGSLFQRDPDLSMVQPRLNMAYSVIEGWKVKGSYGRFNQNIITVNNEDDVIPIFDAWIRVPNELKSETADHYVFGVEGNIWRTLSTSFQGYYKHYGSLVTYNRDKVDAIDPDYVNGSGRSYGLETLIRYGDALMDLYAAYTLGWTLVTLKDFEYPPRYDRRHSINLLGVAHLFESLDITIRWEIGSGFPFTQSVGYYDRNTFDDVFDEPFVDETGKPYILQGRKNGARLPWYHRLDFSLTYRFNLKVVKGNAGLHLVNVYDRKNIFYFDRKTGQRVNMLPFFPSATLNLEI